MSVLYWAAKVHKWQDEDRRQSSGCEAAGAGQWP